MEIVLQDRLFLFMFGGRDATYKEDQLAYKNVYECRVAKTIWETYWHGKVAGNPGGRRQRLKALVMLATFDHYDLQMLVMDRFDAPRMGGLPCVEEEYLEGDGEDDEDEEEEDDQEDDLELGGAASAAAAAAASLSGTLDSQQGECAEKGSLRDLGKILGTTLPPLSREPSRKSTRGSSSSRRTAAPAAAPRRVSISTEVTMDSPTSASVTAAASSTEPPPPLLSSPTDKSSKRLPLRKSATVGDGRKSLPFGSSRSAPRAGSKSSPTWTSPSSRLLERALTSPTGAASTPLSLPGVKPRRSNTTDVPRSRRSSSMDSSPSATSETSSTVSDTSNLGMRVLAKSMRKQDPEDRLALSWGDSHM